jgi:hypothetical protein
MTTDFQLKMLELAQQKGWNTTKLSQAQLRLLSIEVRNVEQLTRDAAKAATSRVLTSMGFRSVSQEKAAENAAVCRSNTCGKYRKLTNGDEACDACGCQGKWLKSKLIDASESCPLGRWTNLTVGETDG